MTEHGFSERQACKLLEMDRSSYRYQPKPDKNGPLRQELVALAKRHPRYGYRMLASKLKDRGWVANHKRIERLYRQEHLIMRRLKRKRLTRVPQPMTNVDCRSCQSGMVDGLRRRRVSHRAGDPGVDCDRQLYARVSGH
jgi:hypothetical protein